MIKLLFDSCISWHAARELRALGYDAVAVGELGTDPGDKSILELALAEGRALITTDTDYGRLVFGEARDHAGILLLRGFLSDEHLPACKAALARYGQQLQQGAFVVYEPDKSRVRLTAR